MTRAEPSAHVASHARSKLLRVIVTNKLALTGNRVCAQARAMKKATARVALFMVPDSGRISNYQ